LFAATYVLKLFVMSSSLHILLLSTFSGVLAFSSFGDTGLSGDGLAEHPELLINRQGLAQYDLSIRGSSYTGAGISFNGLNLRTPYSAHFNTELPFPAYLLSNPAVRTGLDNASGHLIGTVAYATPPQEQSGHVSTAIGSKEHYASGIFSYSSGAGGFLEWEKARRIDYAANDLERQAGGVLMQHIAGNWQLDLIGAHQQKKFGAQGYYGVAADQYAEQKTEDSLIVFSAVNGDPEDAFLRAAAGWRQFDDQYTGPAAHDVRSRYATAAIEGRTIEVQHLVLNLRADIEHEQVDETSSADRTRGSILILPEARFEKFILKAGLNTVMQTAESAEWLPLIGADWLVSDNSTLYVSYSESLRQPDYQTLADNPLLQMQQVKQSEMGIRQFLSASLDWRAAAFHRQIKHASDWIGGGATDLGTLQVYGAESALRFSPSEQLHCSALYQWINKDTGRTDGLYELDYPEQLLAVSIFWKPANVFAVDFDQSLRYQTKNDMRTNNDFGAVASLGLHWFPRFANNARLSFRVGNLWGSDFQAIPGLKPHSRSASAGVTILW
jgi:outer membrane receptor protein involved in Fe transport